MKSSSVNIMFLDFHTLSLVNANLFLNFIICINGIKK